jgi:hypothetical protein
VNISGGRAAYSFDHEDFRKFYLGESLGRTLEHLDRTEVHQFLQPGSLGAETAEAAAHFLLRRQARIPAVVELLQTIASADAPASFTKENAGLVTLRLLEMAELRDVTVTELAFPPDALRARHLVKINFVRCYFQPSSLESTIMVGCAFQRCRIDRLELFGSTQVRKCTISDTEVGSLVLHEQDEHAFEPSAISDILARSGFSFPEPEQLPLRIKVDEDSRLFERALRVFLRANQVNEVVFQQRLAGKSRYFIDTLLPLLLRHNIFEEVSYRGSGSQRRFRLSVPMQKLQDCLRRSNGSFQQFLELMNK